MRHPGLLWFAFLARGSALVLFAALGGCTSNTLPKASAPSVGAHSAPSVAAEMPVDLLSDPTEHIAAIHRSKCGSCHQPVEPGSLQREVAESAMQRHRRRAHLSERDWGYMVEYLSSDGMLHPRHTAQVP
jgi:hypothetical protein